MLSNESSPPGVEMALRLVGVFRALVDDVHADLAARGHPDARPIHGFALQAIGPNGVTAAELGVRLGVSKQAAGKTIDRLESHGYVVRAGDPADARRKTVTVSPRGRDLLRLSVAAFDRAHATRAGVLGPELTGQLHTALRLLDAGPATRLDLAGWLGT